MKEELIASHLRGLNKMKEKEIKITRISYAELLDNILKEFVSGRISEAEKMIIRRAMELLKPL